jgi:hypothetical protein
MKAEKQRRKTKKKKRKNEAEEKALLNQEARDTILRK